MWFVYGWWHDVISDTGDREADRVSIHTVGFILSVHALQLYVMRTLGVLVVFVGIGAWSFAGYAYFSSPISTSSPVIQNITAAVQNFHDSFLDPRASIAGAAYAYMYDDYSDDSDFFQPTYYYYAPSPSSYDPSPTYYVYSDDSYIPYPDAYVVVADPAPWYVQTFSGIGSVAQRIIPGQYHSQTVNAPTISSPNPIPTCSIAASPASVSSGGATNLTWRSLNATRAVLDNISDVPVNGSRALQGITSSESFVLEVAGPGGESSCTATVYVQPLVTKQPSCIIALQPTSISPGQLANLSWGSQDAVAAGLSSIGQVPLQGGIRVNPESSTVYTLTVRSASGRSASCATTLLVN